MYRQQHMEKMAAMTEQNIINRVYSLPVMNYAVGQALGLYNKTKMSNKYLQSACGLAEKSVNTALTTAAPIMEKLEMPIGLVNSVACKGLDKLELQYPIISKPTDEVWNKTNEMYEGTMKPYVVGVSNYGTSKVQTVRNAVEEVKGKVDAVKKTTTDTAVGAVTKAQQKTTELGSLVLTKSNAFLSTPAGQVAARKLSSVLNTADQLVETYLPPPTTQGEGADGEEKRAVFSDPASSLGQAAALTVKVYGRLRGRTNDALTGLYTTGMDTWQTTTKLMSLNELLAATVSAYNRLEAYMPKPINEITHATTEKALQIYKTGDYKSLYDDSWKKVGEAEELALALFERSLASPYLSWMVPHFEVQNLDLNIEPDDSSPPRWA